jgi:hypothetical protein
LDCKLTPCCSTPGLKPSTLAAGNWIDKKTLSAIEKGRDIAELQHFLESCDDMPLPDPVAAFIKNCARRSRSGQGVSS